MTAVENLVEETGKLYGNSLKSLEEGFKELSDVEITIQELIEVALDLQKQLSNLIILKIEPVFPIEEENETGTSREDPNSIQRTDNYTLNIGPLSIYSLAETIRDTFTTFEAQKAEIAEIYTPSAFSMSSILIKSDVVESLAAISKESIIREIIKKKVNKEKNIPLKNSEEKLSADDKTVYSGIENLYTDLEKSVLIINELKTVYDDIAGIAIERDNLISEKNSISIKSPDLFREDKKKIENIERSEVTDAKSFQDSIHYFSEMIKDTSKALLTDMSDVYKNADISSLNKILTKTTQTEGIISDIAEDAYLSQKTFKSAHQVSDFSKVIANISEALHQNILETNEIIDISSLNKISEKDSQPAEIITNKQKPVVSSELGIFEIPALRPRGKIPTASDNSLVNAAKLSKAFTMGSREKETISTTSREPVSSPYGTYATSLQSIPAPSLYVSNAFDTISDYIMTATEINRQMTGMMGQTAIDANKIRGQNHPLEQVLLEEGRTALNLHKIVLENSGTANGGQMMNSSLSMVSTEALEKTRSSALNNISLIFPREGDYRLPSPSIMPPAINVLQMVPGSKRELGDGSAGNKSFNFQNTFNIVVNVKNVGKETELRDLGRKIGQVLSDEIRRYGGIR